MSDFFTPVPLDFDRLFQRDHRITPQVYALGCHLAAESYRVRNTDGGVVEEFTSGLAELFEVDKKTVARWLRILEETKQIRCEVEERQRGPWRIFLTGIANPLDKNCPATATSEGRPMPQSLGEPAAVKTAKDPGHHQGLRHQPVSTLPQSDDPTNETNRTNPAGKEKLDHPVGKTTTVQTDPAITDRLIAAVAKREPPVRVEQADDGTLVWSGDPLEDETGVVNDLQAFADAGLGEWVDADDRERPPR